MSKPFIGKRVNEKELGELSKNLLANEQVQGIFTGAMEGKSSQQMGWLVVTNKRVIRFTRGSLIGSGGGSDAFYYINISSVQGNKGMLGGGIELSVFGKTERIDYFQKKEVDLAVNMIRDNVQKARSEASRFTAAPASPLDQIKKLKELLDTGALSREEYEEKKKKLMESI